MKQLISLFQQTSRHALQEKMRQTILMILISTSVGCGTASSVNPPVEVKKDAVEPQIAAIEMDNYTRNKLQALLALRATLPHADKTREIELLSHAFLRTPYVADKLIGSATAPEELVIDFRGLDCFTYLDYVQALRTATTLETFTENVIQTRYINGSLDFLHRKHFFTDWANTKQVIADDITAQLSNNAVTVVKQLNRKADGGVYLPSLPSVERSLTYIPSEFVDQRVISQLQTGDYIGIYTKLLGLDVTHTGFFIMTPQGAVLRNASSRQENMKVVDSPLANYIANTPGIIVLRPR